MVSSGKSISSLTPRRCAGRNARGKPCGGWAGLDSQYCLAHDPARQGLAADARRAGGHARAKPIPAPPADLATPALQRRALEQTIDRLRRGDEGPDISRVVISAVVAARMIVADELLEARIAALEAAAADRAALAELEGEYES